MDWTFFNWNFFNEAIKIEIETQNEEGYKIYVCCSNEHEGGMFIIQACTCI
jgi:hypothetical protein